MKNKHLQTTTPAYALLWCFCFFFVCLLWGWTVAFGRLIRLLTNYLLERTTYFSGNGKKMCELLQKYTVQITVYFRITSVWWVSILFTTPTDSPYFIRTYHTRYIPIQQHPPHVIIFSFFFFFCLFALVGLNSVLWASYKATS